MRKSLVLKDTMENTSQRAEQNFSDKIAEGR